MKKLNNLHELEGKKWEIANIIYKSKNWVEDYSLTERTYQVLSRQNYFNNDKISTSLYGDCLDGFDYGVRLDAYNWEIEYIEIVK